MSFRKRNVRLSDSASTNSRISVVDAAEQKLPGQRPSPLDGRPTTSTGTQSLDDLLAGHAGLPLGHSLLIEEAGTTDFAGILVRYFAAQGVAHNHHVHVIGVPERWGQDLPGISDDHSPAKNRLKKESVESDRMKIAWRYERLGEFDTGSRAKPRAPVAPGSSEGAQPLSAAFCSSFDLTKRWDQSPDPPISYIPISGNPASLQTALRGAIEKVSLNVEMAPPCSTHRVIIPSLLSPAIYPAGACAPTMLLPFLQNLRALLRRFPQQLTAITTLPLSLHPRSSGLVRWIEHLCDGVIEMQPFPYHVELELPNDAAKTDPAQTLRAPAGEKIQGILRVHKLPSLTEKGAGSGARDDMAFSLGRRNFRLVKYHLPPEVGDTKGQVGQTNDESQARHIEF